GGSKRSLIKGGWMCEASARQLFSIGMSRWPSSAGSGLQNREEGCNSLTGLQPHFEHRCSEIHACLPSRNTGRNTRMLDHLPQLNSVCRQRPRTVEVMAGYQGSVRWGV